jgi:hypothetical protein
MMGAAILKTPEMVMSQEESEELAKAAKRVTDLYDVPILDEKTLAWIGLAMVVGKVYGTRAIAVAARVKGSKKQVSRPTPSERVQAGMTMMPDFSPAGVM